MSFLPPSTNAQYAGAPLAARFLSLLCALGLSVRGREEKP